MFKRENTYPTGYDKRYLATCNAKEVIKDEIPKQLNEKEMKLLKETLYLFSTLSYDAFINKKMTI